MLRRRLTVKCKLSVLRCKPQWKLAVNQRSKYLTSLYSHMQTQSPLKKRSLIKTHQPAIASIYMCIHLGPMFTCCLYISFSCKFATSAKEGKISRKGVRTQEYLKSQAEMRPGAGVKRRRASTGQVQQKALEQGKHVLVARRRRRGPAVGRRGVVGVCEV